MQITKPLVRFGLFIFVIDCLYCVLLDTTLLSKHLRVWRLLAAITLSLPAPFGPISGPVILSLFAAGLALALGMWKRAESAPELKALIVGMLLLCIVLPELAFLTVLTVGFAFGGTV